MSYTEFHKGKIKIVARGDEAIKKYIKDNNLEKRLKLDIDEETGKIEYIEDDEPFNGDKWDHEYHMITYRRYMRNVDKTITGSDRYNYNPNADHLLIKYIEHEHFELGEEDIDIHKRISKDEFEFAISFYNGGCCEQEIYEDIINEFDLDEDYEKESESVNITSRESCIILDCFNYVLSKIGEEKNDYPFCNYSKEEIAKLKQKFGDLNLKIVGKND